MRRIIRSSLDEKSLARVSLAKIISRLCVFFIASNAELQIAIFRSMGRRTQRNWMRYEKYSATFALSRDKCAIPHTNVRKGRYSCRWILRNAKTRLSHCILKYSTREKICFYFHKRKESILLWIDTRSHVAAALIDVRQGYRVTACME